MLIPKVMDFPETWKKIALTMEATLRLDHSVDSAAWCEGQGDVHHLCNALPQSLAPDLYGAIRELLETHVQQLHQKIVSEELNESENAYVKYQSYWESFCQSCGYMDNLFHYFNNNSHCLLTREGKSLEEDLPKIGDLAKDRWIEVMTLALVDKVILRVTGEEVVSVDGDAEPLTRCFLESFEQQFLVKMRTLYERDVSALLQELNPSQYMETVAARLRDEEARFPRDLTAGLYDKVSRLAKQKMGTDLTDLLLEECENMIRQEKTGDLANMYTLLRGEERAVDHMAQKLQAHIYDEGLRATSNLRQANASTQFVESLLEVHGKFSQLVDTVLKREARFYSALNKALTSAVNHKEPGSYCLAAELLARHWDRVLRSTKGKTGEELQDKLSGLLTVLRYVEDKDVFVTLYSRMLLRRLADGLTLDSEEVTINLLKQACGYELTGKLHQMNTDLCVSADLNRQFADFLKTPGVMTPPVELGVRFHVHVLHAAAWPRAHGAAAARSVSAFFPPELERSVEMFESFYGRRHSGRRLTWLLPACTAELQMTHLAKPCVAVASMDHMAVLLAFNQRPLLSDQELLDVTRMEPEKLQSTVKSLLDAGILIREEKREMETESSSSFSLNMHFSSKRTKFKVASASSSAQKDAAAREDAEQARIAVEEERKHFLQAAVVRIMKARKKLTFNQLLQEVLVQSEARFKPSVSSIKRSIETLVEKEYMERCPTSNDLYTYLA